MDLVVATPPCQPFSRAGTGAGWKSIRSQAFIACINLIRELYDDQVGNLTYVIENVPGARRFTAITDALGAPTIVNATELGSSARRETTLWTNGGTPKDLETTYRRHMKFGPGISELLQRHGFWAWQTWSPDQHYFPKLICRRGSYAFSYQPNGAPGQGMLLHNRVFEEPSADIREVAMGFPKGATSAPGASEQLRHLILGGCVDSNVAKWIIRAIADQRPTPSPPSGGACHISRHRDRLQHFIVDGGATSHITTNRSNLYKYEDMKPMMVLGLMKGAIGIGNVHIEVDSMSGPVRVVLRGVIYVPGLAESGLSVTRLMSQRATYQTDGGTSPVFTFTRNQSTISFDQHKVPLDHEFHENLYTLHATILKEAPAPSAIMLAASTPPSAHLAQPRSV